MKTKKKQIIWSTIPLRSTHLSTKIKVTPVSSTNKTNSHNITKILLKVVLNTITLPNPKITKKNLTYADGNPCPGFG